jgi:glutamyl-tRNA synthetase
MVRTRFAPSPTGYLHIGGVRTALFNWLFARRHGGQFILRIDDTDQQRNVEQALAPILHGFRWLGIDWDEGPEVGGPHAPYFQSQRLTHYQAAVKTLLDRGFVYRDYARTEEIQAEREAAEKEKRQFVYSRRFMAETPQQQAAFEAEGRQGVVRLKMPREGKLILDDLVRGRVEFSWAAEQDHVIQRADGTCLYHLANVVDDHDFEITHVIRAEEHLPNTPRQVFMVDALYGEEGRPQYAHLPYVAEPGSKNKLSKRKIAQYLKNPDFKKLYDHGKAIADRLLESSLQAAQRSQHARPEPAKAWTPTPENFNPVLVEFYEKVGYLPDAILNYLLLLGWSLDDKTEHFTREDMLRLFSLERVVKAPASFDPGKLMAFQDRHMRLVPLKQKVPMVLAFLQQAGWVAKPPPCDMGPKLQAILAAAGDRIKTAGDILDYPEFFLPDEALSINEKDFEQRLRKPSEAAGLLGKFRDRLADVEPFDPPTLERTMQDFIAAEGIKIGQIIHALRVAVTGKSVGAGMFETLALVGKPSCLARINQALKRVAT